MITPPPKNGHPATFSKQLWDVLIKRMDGAHVALDPFSGTGLIHRLAEAAGVSVSIGIELEPEWANVDEFDQVNRIQVVADAFEYLPLFRNQVDAVVTSPAYGNRMADHHDAKEKCKACIGSGLVANGLPSNGPEKCEKCGGVGRRTYKRNTYRHSLGRPLTDNNSGGLQWGDGYREFHSEAWRLCAGALRRGGRFILNIKDHVRKHEFQDVPNWHADTIESLGFVLVEEDWVNVSGNRQGSNYDKRADHEVVYTFMKEKS